MAFSDFVTFMGGTLFGGLVAHIFTRSREADKRRGEFRQFLGKWRHAIQRVSEGNVEKTYEAYLGGERAFAGHLAKLKGDFWRWRKFNRLCAPLQERLPEHIRSYKGDCREMIAKPIEELIRWL